MAFYAGRAILEPRMENPTIVVITDRNDLDDQLFGRTTHTWFGSPPRSIPANRSRTGKTSLHSGRSPSNRICLLTKHVLCSAEFLGAWLP